MKLVTKERLIRAIKIVEARRDSRCKEINALMQIVPIVRMRPALGLELGGLYKRIALEFNYQGINPEEEEILPFVDNQFALRQHYNSWLGRIREIQESHNIKFDS